MEENNRKVVIELQNVKRYFQVGSETVKALRGVSFKIYEGEFVTIQGTSGSGKSTLLNQLGCLDTPTAGEYLLDGVPVSSMSKTQRAHLRNQKIGFVFQNYNLLAKTTAVENVELPLFYQGVGRRKRHQLAMEELEKMGLTDWADHYPNEMSGGQRQRVSIASAMILNPEFLICDECVSSLDVLIQAQILNLLKGMQKSLQLTYLFISHNLNVVAYMADRIGVMYKGQIVEEKPTAELLKNPEHEYTKRLLEAAGL